MRAGAEVFGRTAAMALQNTDRWLRTFLKCFTTQFCCQNTDK